MNWSDPDDISGLEVKVAQLLVATADESDTLIDGAVFEVLQLMRERMKMDVVFVSEFTDGARVLRCVSETPGQQTCPVGSTDPLEETWCQRVVDGRLPEFVPDGAAAQASGAAPAMAFPVGTYLATPVVLSDGQVYGTLCCFSYGINTSVTAQNVKTLRYTANLTAQKIGQGRRQRKAVRAGLSLEPLPDQEDSRYGTNF